MVRKAQKVIDDHGVLVPGAEGALKPNPASGLLWRNQAIVARLAAELGLTPASRAKTSQQTPKEEENDLLSLLDI
jgi:P27 family predicted phage terminase small subunit